MEYEIVNQTKNPLLEREELIVKIESETTPTKEDVKKFVDKNPEQIVIKKINSSFGKKEYLAEVQVYDTIESREKYEVIPKKIRVLREKERKEAEAAAKKAEEEKAAAEEAAKAEAEAKTSEEEKEEEKVEETPEKEEDKTEEPKEEKEKPVEETKDNKNDTREDKKE